MGPVRNVLTRRAAVCRLGFSSAPARGVVGCRSLGKNILRPQFASVRGVRQNGEYHSKEDNRLTRTDDNLGDLMMEDAQRPPSGDKLVRLQETVAQLRDLELQREDINRRSAELGTKIHEIRTKTLVDQFDEVGISRIGIPAAGNLPAYEIELIDHVKANLGNLDDKEFSKAIAWLEKKDLGDMIKTSIAVDFGMGKTEETKRKKLVAFLEKNAIPFSSSFGVPWNTLTAYVKGQLREKKPVPLKLLGATVERTAALVKPKKTKALGDTKKPAKVKTPLKGK